MKVITRPIVTIVGITKFIEHPNYKIPNDGDDSIKLCAFAAKGCYDSFGENGRANEANQTQIIESKHGSVLEHFYISLFIEGITRACSLELNRHRHLAISQRSTRYTNEENAAIVLDPYYASLEENHPLVQAHIHSCKTAFIQYSSEFEALTKLNPKGLDKTELRKWARGKARNLLPHALETKGTYTGNIRAWRWIIESRSSRYAEEEIRRLANCIYDTLYTAIPFYLEDYEMVDMENSQYPELVTDNSKI